MDFSEGYEKLQLAAIEADGGLWKVQAAKNVARYIRESGIVQEAGISVIG